MPRTSLFAIAVVTLFVWWEWRGLDILPTQRFAQRPVTSIRSSPGGIRSYHTINGTGFQGGK